MVVDKRLAGEKGQGKGLKKKGRKKFEQWRQTSA